mgnify:CR=1 FL=1
MTMFDAAVLMGSKSDMEKAQEIVERLAEFGWKNVDIRVLSAHRDHTVLDTYLKEDLAEVYIAVAGLAAALPGHIASLLKHRVVIGVPLSAKNSPDGYDSLLAITQMPPGVAVGCVAIDGTSQAADLAAEILGYRSVELEDVPIVVFGEDVSLYDPKGLLPLLKEHGVKYEVKGFEELDKEALTIPAMRKFILPKRPLCIIADDFDSERPAELTNLLNDTVDRGIVIRVPLDEDPGLDSVPGLNPHGTIKTVGIGDYLTVGFNSYKNAALLALKILALNPAYQELGEKLRG